MDSTTHRAGEGGQPIVKNGAKCEDVQPLLLDFLMGELDQGRASAVVMHLRACQRCRREAAQEKATLEALRQASQSQARAPEHLSRDRHAKLIRAFMHPVWRWIYVHHKLVSVLTALVATALIVTILWHFRPWSDECSSNTPVPVTIGHRGSPLPRGTNEPAGAIRLPPSTINR